MAIVGTQIRDWGHRIIPIGGGRSRHYIVLCIDPPTSAVQDVFVHEYSSTYWGCNTSSATEMGGFGLESKTLQWHG